jgi:hypothetical protein
MAAANRLSGAIAKNKDGGSVPDGFSEPTHGYGLSRRIERAAIASATRQLIRPAPAGDRGHCTVRATPARRRAARFARAREK